MPWVNTVYGKKSKVFAPDLDKKKVIAAYREVLRARRIDEKSIVLYKQNKALFQVSCAGHETVQVAAANCMKPGHDYFYPYYRDMAFCAGIGMSTKEFMLCIMSKASDPNSHGRQMPNHWGHKGMNIVSQSSPTGTQFLQAVGAAIALKREGNAAVAYVSAGEGTTAQGEYHEAINWAARRKLPVIFLIQNNGYAISVPISEQLAGESVVDISSGYKGLNVERIDGLNYLDSYSAINNAVIRARAGGGPSVISAAVVRLQSHSISDNQFKYRMPEEIALDQESDPLVIFRMYLLRNQFISEEELKEIEIQVKNEVDDAALWADKQLSPEPQTYRDHVYISDYPQADVFEKEKTGEELFLVEAVNKALAEELEENSKMLVYGQDVAGGKGGVFGATAGLTDKFGKDRVFNAPLAEASIVGTAIGLATLGFKPVVEIQFGDYIWTAMMQIRNELALMNYRSAGDFSCPAVLRVAVGGYIRGALYHSQNIESFFTHIPGLVVIYPSNAADAKGLLKNAIRAKDPVLFLEHKGLYRQVYAKNRVGDKNDLIPIGKAKVIREGTDATIVSYGALVQKSILAANALEKEGFSIELIDLRTLLPLDTETIFKSVKKTNRLLVTHEDVSFSGFGAEITSQVIEHCFQQLDAPVKRVAGSFAPVPQASELENMVLPQNNDVEEALRELLEY